MNEIVNSVGNQFVVPENNSFDFFEHFLKNWNVRLESFGPKSKRLSNVKAGILYVYDEEKFSYSTKLFEITKTDDDYHILFTANKSNSFYNLLFTEVLNDVNDLENYRRRNLSRAYFTIDETMKIFLLAKKLVENEVGETVSFKELFLFFHIFDHFSDPSLRIIKPFNGYKEVVKEFHFFYNKGYTKKMLFTLIASEVNPEQWESSGFNEQIPQEWVEAAFGIEQKLLDYYEKFTKPF